ncbi:DUF1189 domain-containing protein [Halobacillus salinarum]|uniref:DUF1189 domain-containing protein n=1 Tax=Halobacillus salinarum TaxID=2932257 RepID=A0ABY4ELJ5_9BACI|nr:DUF1189 family protein [Halobacillus salinarum]UOQ44519.1 DUF1189 domain-containing protein [Halobacillus salinarum]
MGFFDSLWHSLQLPKKKAMFHLNRKGMTSTIGYIFILLCLLFLPDLILTIQHLNEQLETNERGLYMAQVFFFYPMYLISMILVGISILAGGALLLKKFLHRKLIYQQLWKMVVYAATIPLIISSILKHTPVPNWISFLLFISILFFYMYKMIKAYPRAKKAAP